MILKHFLIGIIKIRGCNNEKNINKNKYVFIRTSCLYIFRFVCTSPIISRGNLMKKKKPEEVAVEAVNDLFIRDIEKLLFDHKKYDIASHLMKSMGMNKKEINKIINEVKGVQSNA
jgi:hypothetical protein